MPILSTVSSWEVPGPLAGFTNTGLGWDAVRREFLIGDFDNTRVIRATRNGVFAGVVPLAGSPPSSSVQGVAWDSSDGTIWVCHYGLAGAGTIRHYSEHGALLDTISPGFGTGPNGCAYDAANDRVLAVWNDGTFKSYSCSTLSEVESVALSLSGGQTSDGLTIDPSDSNVLWVGIDVAGTPDYVFLMNRTTGAKNSDYEIPADPEDLVFVDGRLWGCFDQFFHGAAANGNRVHKLDFVYTESPPTLSSVAASSATRSSVTLTVT